MADSFGARLRQQRERQHIELATIADQTKISLSLLEGLERDEVQRWPTGIFRRSFVRSYAHAIGLDPAQVVREFLELYPDPAGVIEPVAPLSLPAGETGRDTPPTRLRYLIERAVDSIPGRRAQRDVPSHEPAYEIPKPATPAFPSAPVASPVPAPPLPNLMGAAHLCTELARVTEPHDLPRLLEDAAKLLDAVGLIVWVWDCNRTMLRPALAHGYAPAVLAQLPGVGRDSDNATAMAFRCGEPRIVNSSESESGALVVPLMTAAGCGGVLAIELRNGQERSELVLALAMIFAAQLATLVGVAPVAKAANG